MAARILRPRHQDDIRQKIQATQLVHRLTKHALGEIEMTATQIKATEILLKKSIPDLSTVEMTADIEHKGEIGLRPQLSREEWLALHKGKP